MKQLLKRLLFGSQRKARRIPLGLYRGLTLSIDPKGELAYFFGTYELETHRWLKTSIGVARSFVDIGAGNGELIAWALAHANIEKALAFDAASERWGLFQENLILNGFAKDSRLKAECSEFLSTRRFAEDFRSLKDLPEPILFKMDIDGGEEHVLQAMGELLGEKRMMILIETHSEELDAACLALLRNAGYEATQIPRSRLRWLLPENRPIAFNQWIKAKNFSMG